MPRPISLVDIEYQDIEGYPVSVAERMKQWDLTEDLHWDNRSPVPAALPGVLELIGCRPGEAGLVIAADRLQALYEAGIPVISTSGLLFGERFLRNELRAWETFVQPGQAVCLTDSWYDIIHPQFLIPGPSGTMDFYPSPVEWSDFLVDLAAKLHRVIAQGSLVVFVFTPGSLHPFNPTWANLVDSPKVIVTTGGSPQRAISMGQYITTEIEVAESGDVRALYQDYPLAPAYAQLTSDKLWKALPLTAVFDYDPQLEHRS